MCLMGCSFVLYSFNCFDCSHKKQLFISYFHFCTQSV
jgi:hypothetical protein